MLKKIILIISLLFFGCVFSPEMDYKVATFKVSGKSAIMVGTIDSSILATLQELFRNHPQIETIVMQDVEGSVDDESNLEAAKYIRRKKMNTYIPYDGLIASGGTDFFLAGVKRTVAIGAKIGVHSWGGEDIDNAAKLPKDHPEHEKYLDYYKEMAIPAEFYWFTLNAATSENIHWMTIEEIKKYNIATEWDKKK